MKCAVLLLVIISIQRHYITTTNTEVTENIETRIKLLKRELLHEIEANRNLPRAYPFSDQYSEMYQYVNNDDLPITPIPDSDKRKLKEKYKLPELITTTTDKYIPSDTSVDAKDDGMPLRMKVHKKKVFRQAKFSKPRDIFYRKMILDDEERNKPQKWTHCVDLITPYLNGLKDNVTYKHVLATDGTVVRLAQLLSINVTDSTKDDIRSILYQISNLQLRIFQWDVAAIKTIFNVIIKNGTHDFRGLKFGLKEIFSNWKLDISDITSFLKQSRIFRPPCIKVSEFEGSTLTTKVVRYTKSTTKKCPDSDTVDCSV